MHQILGCCPALRPVRNYISVRRHFIFIEHSIDEGLQWVVFEPKGRK